MNRRINEIDTAIKQKETETQRIIDPVEVSVQKLQSEILEQKTTVFGKQCSVVLHLAKDVSFDDQLRDYINKESIKLIVIPYGISSIGEKAFCECAGLVSVIIPESVKIIGDSSFDGCISLSSITIPDCVTNIGDSAFKDCKSLTSVTIPDSVKSIGEGAFSRCKNLPSQNGFIIIRNVLYGYNGLKTTITIPDNVTSIGDEAFYGCSKLTSVTIPDSVTSIGRAAFCGCRNLPSKNGFIIIRNVLYAYNGNNTAITIPDSVTSIGYEAFGRCKSLTIKGKKGSYAETYAKYNRITFHAI